MVSIPSLEVVRSSIRSLWTDTMTVEVMGSVEDPDTKITSSEPPRVVIHDAPCRISFETVQSTVDHCPCQEQVVVVLRRRLIFPWKPDNGHKTRDVNGLSSVKPAIYPTHQEILLELEERHG